MRKILGATLISFSLVIPVVGCSINKEPKDTPSSIKESSVDRKWSAVQAKGIPASSPDLYKIRRKINYDPSKVELLKPFYKDPNSWSSIAAKGITGSAPELQNRKRRISKVTKRVLRDKYSDFQKKIACDEGTGGGGGAVLGAIVGGFVGNKISSGNGKLWGTALGAAAGSQVGKKLDGC
jgi:hypothetical protein